MSPLERKFIYVWHEKLKGPRLQREHQFCRDRKWRFDFCQMDCKVAVEIEGGFDRSKHRDFGGFTQDCGKYNRALLEVWRVFRLTGPMIDQKNLDPIIDLIDCECGRNN